MTFNKQIFIFLLAALIRTSQTLTTDVDCQPGWSPIGVQCYRLFTSMSPWNSADKVCKSYGSELATVTDYYENEDVGKFVGSKGKNKFWIGQNRIDVPAGNLKDAYWSNGDKTVVFTGFWKNFQPDIPDSGKCVYIENVGNSYKWSFAQCESKMSFLCQRPACPAGSFHCLNTECINPQLTCDGEDDCGDSSDETNCPSRCSTLLKQSSGTVVSQNHPNAYPVRTNCQWTIQVPSGSNVVLEFHAFNTEQGNDVVEILEGGPTEAMSQLVKRLSGNLSGKSLKFISSNNFMIIKFTSDSAVTANGFNASFYAKNANFPDYKKLTAVDAKQKMMSPLYDMGWNYLGNQDYVWIITAEKKTMIITLQVEELDLKGNDQVLVRDGDSVSDSLLATYKGNTVDMPYVFSTGNKMYIIMQTFSYWTGKGFKFNYIQGCSAMLTKDHGHIYSPGYGVANYANNQVCKWTVDNEADLTFLVQVFNTQQDTDILKISFTPRTAGATEQSLETLSGSTKPNPIRRNGIFHLQFKTDAIITDKGFSIKYSKDCKDPKFNSHTVLNPANVNWWYGSSFEVSCKAGYHFTSKEFQNTTIVNKFVSVSVVKMQCQYGGEWNTRSVPTCEPMYCGQAPPVERAYIATSYPKGPESSVFNGIVNYECYPGFTMSGTANITCLTDGAWGPRPKCTVASCPSLALTIPNGSGKKTEGDGTGFGTILEYSCDPGYHIVGDAIIFCQTSSKWSAVLPSCKKMTCTLPMIKNGVLKNNNKIYYQDTKKVTCNTGYEFSAGVKSKILTCKSDQTFDPSLDTVSCKDTDECASKTCEHNCTNTDGSYVCSCWDGFTLNADKLKCDDIDECAVNKGGCTHACTNSVGGYTCSCSKGYTMYTTNGTEGYSIPPAETGMLAGDLYHINHTCVRKLCPDAPVITNGYVLSKRKENRYGDSIEISCKIGFRLTGTPVLQCNASGAWNESPPTCSAAQCPQDTIPAGLKTVPTVNPTKPVGYLDNVTLQCNVPGKDPFTRYRNCLYQQPQDKYLLDGAPYECGVIDCGKPPETPGAVTPTTATTYNSTFTFQCKSLYQMKGKSADGNTVVRCEPDGYWGFNTLQCLGKTCTDPGRPVDGYQSMQTKQYQESSEVYFNCSRPGFTIQGTNPIKCIINGEGTGLNWSAKVPTCTDTEKPTFVGCVETKAVSRYSVASAVVTVPEPKDNHGIASFTILPQWPSNQYIIDDNVIFTFTATDFDGNSETCLTKITIKDEIKPKIQCPKPEVRYITTEADVIEVPFNINKVTVSDNSGKTPSVVFNPKTLYANASSVNSVIAIQATAKDEAGNTNTCQFEYLIKATPCSPMSLVTPVYGIKKCTARTAGAGYTCDLTCPAGYVFYDQSDATAKNVFQVQCDTGVAWSDNIPACANAKKSSATFQQKVQVLYSYSGNISQDSCKTVYADVIKNKFSRSELLKAFGDICNSVSIDVTSVSTVNPENDIVIDDTKKTVRIYYTITFKSLGSVDSSVCATVLRSVLQAEGSYHSNTIAGELSPFVGCPTLKAINQTISDGTYALVVEVSSNYMCPGNKKMTKYARTQMCLECPRGFYNTDGNTCKLCPKGKYTDRPGQSSCLPCDAGTTTYNEGSVLKSQCLAICPLGTTSDNELQPCARCPLNEYGVNSTHCKACPTDSITHDTGATLESMCKAKCAQGYYNANDGHEVCLPCPKDFFQTLTGQVKCERCSENTITAATGSISADNCTIGGDKVCSKPTCSGHGSCIINHQSAVCTCTPGYTGERCENTINQCLSEPCYNNGACFQNGTSYYCKCLAGTAGDNCETDLNECSTNPCDNEGMCQNLVNSFKCHCAAGYGGANCSTVEDVCVTSPCKNDALCIKLGNIRRTCMCRGGYTGKDCSENIDDCESNPCYYNGKCTDQHLGFKCTCPSGYTGNRCEHPPQKCAGVSCGNGQCVEDYIHDTYRCICNAGVLYGKFCQFTVVHKKPVTNPANTMNNLTAEACRKTCDGRPNCESFTYNFTNSMCSLHGAGAVDLTDSDTTNYYVKTCSDRSDDFWTPWYNTKSPSKDSSSKDEENKDTLAAVGIEVCKGTTPLAVECRDVSNKLAPTEAVTCTVTDGLLCVNSKQGDGQCMDYEIRFKCAVNRVFTKNTCTSPNFCKSNPCVHGSCVQTATGFTCSCQQGYTGALCQHDIDYCADKPCQNGGVCEDRLLDYHCNCTDGFNGITCENNINECLSSPCKNGGKCQDRINGYECECAKGWKGTNCEVDINECDLGEPCLHNSECKNTNGSYVCKCVTGWTDAMSCSSLVKPCAQPTCNNNAQCLNLFNDFFCKCKANTYGKKCESSPSICNSANPCQHMNSCKEAAGTATCTCSDDYEGKGCELRVDHCKAQTCQNGGTCSQTATSSYRCTCPTGYEGDNCEQNSNNCNGVTCSGGTCVDGVDQYFCRCPVGKTGAGCQKDVDRKYDLLFNLPQKTNMASLPYPIVLNVTKLTISIWVKFWDIDGTGTFFSMFSVKTPNCLSGKKEMLRLDEKGLSIKFDGKDTLIEFPFYKYNDGHWNNIIISWDSETGLLSFIVNTIKHELIQNYAKGVHLEKNVWLLLGSKYDTTKDMPVFDKGFNGWISQLNIYDRILNFNTEVQEALEKSDKLFPGSIFVWNEFVYSSGVKVVNPSTASYPSCPRGFSNPDCRQADAKKVMVKPTSCPSDIAKLGSTRITPVTWTAPTFSGVVDNVKSTYSSGDSFLWGKYLVIYVAENKEGNKGLCSFKIFVQYSVCPKPADPYHGGQLYSSISPYYVTSIVCTGPERAVVRPTPKLFTCGRSGSWYPPQKYLTFKLPPCGVKKTNTLRALRIRLIYKVGTSNCDGVKETLEKEIMTKIKALNVIWLNLCKETNCADIQIKIQCGENLIEQRRKRATRDVIADVVLPLANVEVTSTSGETLLATDVLKRSIFTADDFNFEKTISNGVPIYHDVVITADLACSAGQALVQGECVECTPGTFYNNETKMCDDCPIGKYQPQAGQTTCETCSSGRITENTGSMDSSNCKVSCQPGEFFNLKENKCEKCDFGFYQSLAGQFFCEPCVVENTTRAQGSTSVSDCYNDCPAGQEISQDGTCKPCPIGKYRTANDRACTNCPEKTTTNATGATSVALCNVGDCQLGFYRNIKNELECKKCAIGYYQNQSQQYECISCGGERFTTDNMGSTQQNDCKFFCPDGQEQQDPAVNQCTDCEIGFYRNSTGQNRFKKCQQCVNNKRTLQKGSVSETDCTLYRCSAGEEPTAKNVDCKKCDLGFFQELPDQSKCNKCPDMTSTRLTGTKNASQCEKYCRSGYEMDSKAACQPCPVGYYKDNTVDKFGNCTQCGRNMGEEPVAKASFVTETRASVSADNCTIPNCLAGYKINNTNNGCDKCPRGTYQPDKYQKTCIPCSGKTSTQQEGSTRPSDCQVYCNSGYEKNPSTGACDICPRGYFKDNNEDLFSMCTVCPDPDLITPGKGATSKTQCTVRNCSAGYYLDTTKNVCNICPKGSYSDVKWSEKCTACDTDKTTVGAGATNETQCILSCPPGKEDVGQAKCVACKRGFFKDVTKAAPCTECSSGFTTSGEGSKQSADCSIAACMPGEFLIVDSNKCSKCAYGFFQNEKWQETCKKCNDKLTTYKLGAASEADCLPLCQMGEELTNGVCTKCKRGYYQDKAERDQYMCKLCPNDQITASEGATSVGECSLANCTTPGYYRDRFTNKCVKCKRGTYQNSKWEDACIPCVTGYTTKEEGSYSNTSCLRDCPSGQQLDEANDRCVDCVVGTYRDRSASWQCVACSNGLTTEGTKAVAVNECSVSPCNPGAFFNGNTKQCEMCPMNKYQSVANSFSCEPCPSGYFTSEPGKKSKDDCKGLCEVKKPNCSEHAVCVNEATGPVCKCNSDYTGNGVTCVHKCDDNYCNTGTCVKGPPIRCLCDDIYTGNQCQIRKAAQSVSPNTKETIIIAVVTVVAILLFIIMIVVCICVMARKRHAKRPMNDYDDRASIATRLSTKNYDNAPMYASKPPSVAGSRYLLPQQQEQQYMNPVYNIGDEDPAIYKA